MLQRGNVNPVQMTHMYNDQAWACELRRKQTTVRFVSGEASWVQGRKAKLTSVWRENKIKIKNMLFVLKERLNRAENDPFNSSNFAPYEEDFSESTLISGPF